MGCQSGGPPDSGDEPIPHELLVERGLRPPGQPGIGRPVARRVGCGHLIPEDRGAVFVEAELELGVGEDDPRLRAMSSARE